jgi:hypothetical protein
MVQSTATSLAPAKKEMQQTIAMARGIDLALG